MSDPIDEDKGKQTPPASSAEDQSKKTDPNSSGGSDVTDKDKDSGEKEHMIPKHRFDEVAEKARIGEQAMNELTELKSRIAGAFGGKVNDPGAVDEIKALSDKYGLKDDFVKDMLSLSTARAERKLEDQLKPLKAQQAQAYLNNEFAALEETLPEGEKLSKEERADLEKMAIEPRYHKVPLVDLWKIKNFGKPAGKTKTAEPSRGGSARADDGEVDIKSMSHEDFEKFSNDLAKKKK